MKAGDQEGGRTAARRSSSIRDDATIGVRAWDVQSGIVLRIGPLERESFTALLPDRPALERLVALVRAYLGFAAGFAINPVVAAAAVRLCNYAPTPIRPRGSAGIPG